MNVIDLFSYHETWADQFWMFEHKAIWYFFLGHDRSELLKPTERFKSLDNIVKREKILWRTDNIHRGREGNRATAICARADFCSLWFSKIDTQALEKCNSSLQGFRCVMFIEF